MCWPNVLPSCGLGLGGGEGDVCTTMAISTVSLTRKGMPTCGTHICPAFSICTVTAQHAIGVPENSSQENQRTMVMRREMS